MILSKRKLEIGQVSFDGHIVGADGVHPHPVCLDTIFKFPTTMDITALCSFLGLANQLGTYLSDLAAASTKLHILFRTNVFWVGTSKPDDEFNTLLTSATIVKHFDPSLRSVILTDANAASIGFTLVQHGPDGAPGSSYAVSGASTRQRRVTPRWSWRRLEPPSPFRSAHSTCSALPPPSRLSRTTSR